jgi:DNA-binding NarL/FixJ family response regulator
LLKQVGGQLGISEITVKADRGHVMQKRKAPSLADLVKRPSNTTSWLRRKVQLIFQLVPAITNHLSQ